MKELDKNRTFSNLSEDEVLKKRKKIESHCVNLECQKQQLLILIEKLYKISGDRINLLSSQQNQNLISKYTSTSGNYLFSIGDQLDLAQKNRKRIETEISNAKKQIDDLEKVLKNKKQS